MVFKVARKFATYEEAEAMIARLEDDVFNPFSYQIDGHGPSESFVIEMYNENGFFAGYLRRA